MSAFYGCVIVPHEHTSCSVDLFIISWWMLGCFHPFAILHIVSVQFLLEFLLPSQGCIPRKGISLLGLLCFTFWGTTRLFSTVASLFRIPTNRVWGFQFHRVLANTHFPVRCCGGVLGHAREVLPHGSSGFGGIGAEHHFMDLLGFCVSSVESHCKLVFYYIVSV